MKHPGYMYKTLHAKRKHGTCRLMNRVVSSDKLITVISLSHTPFILRATRGVFPVLHRSMSQIAAWRPSPTPLSPFGYWHHGVLCPDQTVIHYCGGKRSSSKGSARVERTTLQKFLRKSVNVGGLTSTSVYRVRHRRQLDAATVVQRAESRIGARGYSLIFNNCEHFARWCVLGGPAISPQAAAAGAAGLAGLAAAGPVGAFTAVVAERFATGLPILHPNFVPLHCHYATGYVHYPQPPVQRT